MSVLGDESLRLHGLVYLYYLNFVYFLLFELANKNVYIYIVQHDILMYA
jgi:hypothetical protein